MSASLNNIVSVSVEVSNPSVISSDFNLGLIIGKSAAIKNQRVKVYTAENFKTQMVADGFTTDSNEYKAAVLYFAQTPKSASIAVGAWDATGSETPADAFTACRAKNENFYNFCFVDTLTDEQISAVAALVEASTIPTAFWFTTSDKKCIAASSSNILKTLQGSKYTRTFGIYSSSEPLIAAAAVGMVSGLNSLTVNSAYTAAYKTLAGVSPENLSNEELDALTSYNGNVYTEFGNTYKLTYPMVSSGDYHVDDLLLIDVAKFLIQQKTVAGLVSMRKIKQTEEGVGTLVSFINGACDQLANIGMIAGGIWKGDPVVDLNTGDAIENGYLVQAGTVADQSAQDRANRVSPPIYVALLSSGAIEHVVIAVYMNR